MFRTELHTVPSPWKIGLNDRMLSIGSCFATNIGEKLREHKLHISVNPFGTLFNPHSIFKLLQHSAKAGKINEDAIVANQGIYYHFDFHGDQSTLNKAELIHTVNRLIDRTHHELPELTTLIVTFGTAIVYEWKESGEIVANCHKVPSSNFHRRMMEVDEIVLDFQRFLEVLSKINPNATIILTVSPVRHMKETFEQNNLSKSILRIACDRMVKSWDRVSYFPAFEIMMDDLRDYRFYADDMLHPNTQATEYIWQKFMTTYFDIETIRFVEQWSEIRKALLHRPFQPESNEHQQFIMKTMERVRQFSTKVNVEDELRTLSAQLLPRST